MKSIQGCDIAQVRCLALKSMLFLQVHGRHEYTQYKHAFFTYDAILVYRRALDPRNDSGLSCMYVCMYRGSIKSKEGLL